MNKEGSATADYWCWEVCVCVCGVVCGMWHSGSGSGSGSKEVDDKMLHVTSSSTRTRK
jgi:hypothetical protein